MKEYCLVNAAGTVLNMAQVHSPREPFLSDEQKTRGLRWVPVDKVNQFSLRQYKYWNQRP